MEIDITKLSGDWAAAEVFSGKMVWMFSIVYLVAAAGFWYFGKTDMAKAFIWPLLIAGLFLVAVGAGLVFANQPRIKKFKLQYQENPKVFVQQEIERTGNSEQQLELVFKILPAITIAAAILILFLPNSPIGRTIGITLIITAAFLMAVDSNTARRNTLYHQQLVALNHDHNHR